MRAYVNVGTRTARGALALSLSLTFSGVSGMWLIANLRGGHMAALASRCESLFPLVPQRKSVRPSQTFLECTPGISHLMAVMQPRIDILLFYEQLWVFCIVSHSPATDSPSFTHPLSLSLPLSLPLSLFLSLSLSLPPFENHIKHRYCSLSHATVLNFF